MESEREGRYGLWSLIINPSKIFLSLLCIISNLYTCCYYYIDSLFRHPVYLHVMIDGRMSNGDSIVMFGPLIVQKGNSSIVPITEWVCGS